MRTADDAYIYDHVARQKARIERERAEYLAVYGKFPEQPKPDASWFVSRMENNHGGRTDADMAGD